MRLELSRSAEADLGGIRDYSLTQFGADRTIAYLDAIEAAFRRLIDYPEIGAPHWIGGDVRSLACERHRILYEIEKEAIRVLRVLHQAMDVRRHL